MPALLAADIRPKAHRVLADAPFNDLLQAFECAAADEENVLRVDVDEALLRMLAPSFRRHARERSFQDLQQRLLHTFT